MAEVLKLACPSCLCLCDKNYKLPCGHSMCASCINDSVHRSKNLLKLHGTLCREGEEVVCCVVCKEMWIKSQCVKNEDNELNDRVKEFKENGSRKEMRCHWKGCTEAAKYFHSEVGMACKKHMEEVQHCDFIPIKEDADSAIEWLEKNRTRRKTCDEHGKEIDCHCKKCDVDICFKCFALGGHMGHEICEIAGKNVMNMRNVLHKRKGEFASLFVELENLEETLGQEIDAYYEREIERLQNEWDGVKQELAKVFEERTQEMDERQGMISMMTDAIEKAVRMTAVDEFHHDERAAKNIAHKIEELNNESRDMIDVLGKYRDKTVSLVKREIDTKPLITLDIPERQEATHKLFSYDTLRQTQSEKWITTPFTSWSYHGMIYDRRRNQLVLRSSGQNSGRDFVFVRFNDDGTTSIEVKNNLISFTSILHVYDGDKYMYIYGNGSQSFVRLNLETHQVESLQTVSGYSYTGCGGYFDDGKIYMILRDASNNNCYLYKYTISVCYETLV